MHFGYLDSEVFNELERLDDVSFWGSRNLNGYVVNKRPLANRSTLEFSFGWNKCNWSGNCIPESSEMGWIHE